MPTEEENVQYLYLVLTHGGNPVIDWDAVGKAMDLKKGAVSKRWSRLKKAMENGEKPSSSVYQFLWLCVKHSTRDKALNWKEIAEKCGTTSGAASKRYSRMKQAFENGDATPGNGSATGSPIKNTQAKSTPRKTKAAAAPTDDAEGTPGPTPTPTPKRKRASPKKKQVIKEEDEDEDEDIKVTPDSEEANDADGDFEGKKESSAKKAKVTKAKATPKPKADSKAKAKDTDLLAPTTPTEAATIIKSEDDGDDKYFDAQDQADDEEPFDPCSTSTTTCALCECHAKEIANVLMSRSSRLAERDRLDLEQIVAGMDLTN